MAGQERQRATITVRVTPRAKRNEIAGVMDDGTIKVRLTAPPVEGKANQALLYYLAEVLQIPRGEIEILSGASGRTKRVAISGMDGERVLERIRAHIA